MPNADPNITAIVQAFARQITAAVEASAVARIQAALSTAFGIPARRKPGRPPRQVAAVAAAAPPAKKRKKASPELIRARKLQGQYLGALKSLNVSDKAKVKAVAKDKGVAVAVKLAASLKRKK